MTKAPRKIVCVAPHMAKSLDSR